MIGTHFPQDGTVSGRFEGSTPGALRFLCEIAEPAPPLLERALGLQSQWPG